MDIEALDLNLLRVFDAVYRERNLSRAAARLRMSQPGVSQALNRLRQHTGDALFIRQAHGVAPTAYSDAISEPVAQALNGLQNVLMAPSVRDIRQSERRLRVAMSDYSQSLILAPLIRLLDAQAPRLQLRILPDDGIELQEALSGGDLDLVVGAIPPLVEYFRHQDLCTEELVCIARAGHPEIQGQIDLDAYRHAEHVGVAVRAAQVSRIDAACAAHGFQRQIKVIVPNFLPMPFIIAATDCVATMPRRLLRLAPPHLGLQVMALPFDLPTAIIRQFWAERNHHDPVCCWLREQIWRVCQTL